MGRFASTVDFYAYREPYPCVFFEEVARRLKLTKQTRLLDVGCGPGNLVIGLASFVGSCSAIDIEPDMLDAARENAARAGVAVTFLQMSIDDMHGPPSAFDLITIGRALHWLPRKETLTVFNRILAEQGHIAICGASGSEIANAWMADYRDVRKAWSCDPDESRYKIDFEKWFEGSRFRKVEEIAVPYAHQVTVSDLVKRALSFSTTSTEVIGDRRSQFEAEIEAALAPFARGGRLEEQLTIKATVIA
ncbi:MAG TPA: class I SAM-dependent methyltransferase [Bryobacteraceae bacterium]|nr:class I SAM-dependent methyltransferase [Bryobacteraceae bacterium]